MRNLQTLLDAAFDTATASDANAAISRVREEHSARVGTQTWSYEVLVPEEGAEDFLVRDTLPRLTYFLHSRGSPLGAEMFLSLFVKDRLYFVAMPDALAVLSEWSGLSLEDMKNRWSDGYGQPPLMLPGPRK